MNVLQDYFNRMTALNRQRGMTGNMQYGQGLDAAIAEGYFDSYQKNKQASQTLANQNKQLDIQQQNANTHADYYRAATINNARQLSMQKKAYSQSNALGWGAVGAQALGYAGKIAYDRWNTPKTDVPYSYEMSPALMGDFNAGTMTDYNIGKMGETAGTYSWQAPEYSLADANAIQEPDWFSDLDWSGWFGFSE